MQVKNFMTVITVNTPSCNAFLPSNIVTRSLGNCHLTRINLNFLHLYLKYKYICGISKLKNMCITGHGSGIFIYVKNKNANINYDSVVDH